MIGFAGPRVIKETTHQDLPERFQTAEFLEEHGLIDLIVHRKKMRETGSRTLLTVIIHRTRSRRGLRVATYPLLKEGWPGFGHCSVFGIKLGLGCTPGGCS